MKKLIIKLLIIASAIILYVTVPGLKRGFKTPTERVNRRRIALFTPITHPALGDIEQGFKDELQKLTPQLAYDFSTFNANGNRTLLRAQAEEIVQGDYDLIFSMGALCTQTIAELLKKKGIKTPQVFGGVEGPGFAESVAATNEFSTGVYVKPDYKQEMKLLHTLKPTTKNILLVYDPTQGTGQEKYKQEIEEYLKPYGSTLHSVEIYQTNEIQQKVAGFLPTMDVVLVLPDNTVVAGIDSLIALCNRYGVTLLASDLNSGKKGAALAYGVTEYESGTGAAKKAAAILAEGKKPHKLGVSPVIDLRIEINKETMKPQHLEIDEATLKRCEGKNEC